MMSFHKTEVMIHRKIVRRLTSEYDTECRVLFRRRNLPRNELEEILRDRFGEIQAGKPAGRQNDLFAGAQGCGGHVTGGNDDSRRGNRNKGGRGGGGGGRDTQGATASSQG